MGTKTDAVKVAARSAFYVLSRAFGFAALGGVLNLVLLPFLWPAISRHLHLFLPNLPHGGGAAVIFVLAIALIQSLPGILLAAMFVIGFPIVYFLMGKKHGVHVAMTRYLKDKKSDLLVFFLSRLFDAIKARPEWLQKIKSSGGLAALHEIIPQYLAKLDNVPRPMRFLLRIVLKKVNVDGVVALLAEAKELDTLDVDQLSAATKQRLNDYLDERFFTPSLRPLVILIVANLIAFALVRTFV